MNDVGHGRDDDGGWDGEERRGMQRNINTVRTVVEFIGAVVLTFIAFYLNVLAGDMREIREMQDEIRIQTTRIEARALANDRRIDRLERTQDSEGGRP